jgi:hypothetical protein
MTRLLFRLVGLCALLCAGVVDAKSSKRNQENPAWLGSLDISPQQPKSGESVKIVAHVQAGVSEVAFEYQIVDPGAYVEFKDEGYAKNWISQRMRRAPLLDSGDGAAMTGYLPAALQKNRRLVRYRLTAKNGAGQALSAPGADAMPPNYAYFVYDGVPAWTGAINPEGGDPRLAKPLTFSAEAMRRVQAYHLVAKRTSVENTTWREQDNSKDYKYTGTLVADGVVYDHVRFRARGGIWRFAMGKNMWKFDLPGQRLKARDDYGAAYAVSWDKVNLRACIQQGDYGHRGEQGMFESVGFRLFNLAGVQAPHTHWIQLRIVDDAEETPSDQYQGDFWGLYLAIENEDGRFLKEHDLPDGNLYKMMGGMGELKHHGAGAVTNRADLFEFLPALAPGARPDSWWQTNFNLASYYSYRSIVECIHHYDIADGKNYDYYRNPDTGKWQVLPWDIDLTWANTMYGGGVDPPTTAVLSRPEFRLEFQNRLREIRDLLYNPGETGRLIDECARVIWDPAGSPSIVEADRRKWDYHPVMAMGGKAGQGRFYQVAPTRDFRGMTQLMKNYVKSRGAFIDAALIHDPEIPWPPAVTYDGPTNFPVKNLRFRVAPYRGQNPFAALKWRLGEIAPAGHKSPGTYEITPVWQSDDLTSFAPEITPPPDKLKPGHTYRARARFEDSTGRWSHWSPPVEFVAGANQ